ncbi:MAG TPA: hypothetical protein VGL91_25305 [Acidobacteriota bacterium]
MSLKGFAVQWPENVIAWLSATSSQPVIIQEAIIHGRELRSPGEPTGITVKSEIRKSPSLGTRREMISVNYFFGSGLTFFQDTGISIVFPGRGVTTPAQGTLILRDFQGEKLAEKRLRISPNAQLARRLSELFPEIAQNVSFRGLLEVVFDQNIFLTAIQVTAILGGNETMDEPPGGAAPETL